MTARERSDWDEAFFAGRRATSRVKHRVLEAYVEKFSYHMPELRYADGFAGTGYYKRADGTTEPGSPVLVAQIAERVHTARPTFHLRCINVEENPERFRRLEEATRPYIPHIVEANFQGRFTDYTVDILERFKDLPAFFFIDPFGTKGICFRDLLPILNRAFTTEALITLHTGGIAKKAGYFRWSDSSVPRKRRVGLAVTENLAAALAVSLDTLREWWSADEIALPDVVLNHYRMQLRAPYTRFQFTKAFPVFYPSSDGGISDRVCFYLMFGTQNSTGLYVMNDCMAKAMEAFKRESYAGMLTGFADHLLQLEHDYAAAALEREIVTRFSRKPFTVDQVKQTVMQETLILLPQGDYRNVILKLARGERLKKIDPGPASNDRTRFQFVA